VGRVRWLRRKRLLLLAVAALAGGLAIAGYAAGTLYSLEAQSVDARFGVRGTDRSLVKDFAIVQIDAQTFSELARHGLRYQWPLPRRYHARVIANLARAGAKVIAVDIAFNAPTDPTDDNALIRAIGNAGNVVLATTFVGRGGYTPVLGGPAEQRSIHATVGNSTVIPDRDGVQRDTQWGYQSIPLFSTAIAARYLGHSIAPSRFGGSVPIDYAGPPGTVCAISYWSAYSDQLAHCDLRGKIVIVGAQASILQDLHSTPTSGNRLMDGPEIQANAAATILARFPLREAPGWVNIALIVLFAAAIPLATLRLAVIRSVALALVLAAAYTVAVQLAFDSGTILAYTYALAALALATLGTLAVVYLGEAFERQRVHQIFARFVPGEVVDQVLARADENLRLGAEERDCTLLFSDLRGFTAFSEHQPPAKVIDAVNYYLNEMTEAILAAGGTLISYMGDGIMACFGAPLDQPDHADRALSAAREMLGVRLPRFNGWLHEQGHPAGFRMGIGLNSGPVMCGNVGSEQRVEYTTLGDVTNTASRLEGMTKGTPFMIFISGSTRERMRDPPDDLVFVDEFEVRGRTTKLPVWGLADPPGWEGT
jgi:adenylate cyclase